DAFTHENQISPRFNAVWQPTEETTLHAGYSRYFTPPPLELVSSPTLALFSNTTAAPATTLNNTPKAERSHYFDVGGTQILFPGFKAGVDLYYRFVDNLLDEGQFGAPIILSAFNYAHGINRGAELTLTYDVGDWHFYGNFAAAKSLGKRIISSQFNFDPADLAVIAGHYIHTDHDQTYTASAGVAYTYPVTNTRFSADMLYGSGLRASIDTPNSTHLPDYQQVNLSVLQKIDTGLFKGLELRLDVVNLLDQKYQIRNGTGVGVGAPQFGPRRALRNGKPIAGLLLRLTLLALTARCSAPSKGGWHRFLKQTSTAFWSSGTGRLSTSDISQGMTRFGHSPSASFPFNATPSTICGRLPKA